MGKLDPRRPSHWVNTPPKRARRGGPPVPPCRSPVNRRIHCMIKPLWSPFLINALLAQAFGLSQVFVPEIRFSERISYLLSNKYNAEHIRFGHLFAVSAPLSEAPQKITIHISYSLTHEKLRPSERNPNHLKWMHPVLIFPPQNGRVSSSGGGPMNG